MGAENNIFTYIFYGKVVPERINLEMRTDLAIEFPPETGIKGEVYLVIEFSIISVIFKSDEEVLDLRTLKVYIESIIRFHVDMLGFLEGVGCRISIDRLVILHYCKGIKSFPISETFGVRENSLINRQRTVTCEDLVRSTNGRNKLVKGNLLRFILADLREAILNPALTPFHCYRALESVMQFFRSKDEKKRKASWRSLKDKLNITDENTFFNIKRESNSIRHGEVPRVLSWRERDDMFLYTYDIIERFIKYDNGE